jgi:hypothetical protein
MPDGSIEVLGRIDDQVKINGYRIELVEIAAVLMQHPSVADCVVIARKEISGELNLVAYFVPKDDHPPDAYELRAFVRKVLPDYMIPAQFIRIDSLPLTISGKIDRKSLPIPDASHEVAYVAPRNEVEKLLAAIWQDVLNVEQVGIHDNFFDLGGASIQSLQMVSLSSMVGFSLGAETIFEYQTIAEVAAKIKRDHDDILIPDEKNWNI